MRDDRKAPNARARLRWGLLIALALVAAALWLPNQVTPNARPSEPDAPSQTTAPTATAAPTDERGAREAAYDKDVATLERLIANESADADTRAQAGERLARMVGEHQSELGVEEALRNAGFDPCYALMQNGSLTVMVGEPELTGNESATILSLCVAHADVSVENVRIMTGLGR